MLFARPFSLQPSLRGALVVAALACLTAAPAAAQCASCVEPSGTLSAPTSTCSTQAGATDATCLSDVWRVDLVAGRTYVFTLCDTTCPGADSSFDSILRVFDPSCVEVASNDDGPCGGGASEVRFTPSVDGTHAIEVTGARDDRFGSYVLGWFAECGGGGGGCAAPDGILSTPTTTCQSVADSTDCADAFAYSVDLTQGQAYTFTLCDATCAGAGAAFDARVELVDPSGGVVASSSAACGDDGEVTYETDPMSGGGTYCVRVVNEGGAGDFTLGYRVACQPPSAIDLSPTLTGATNETCSRTETFVATVAGTGPYEWTWSVGPPPGGSATPAAGAGTSDGNDFAFVSTLGGVGVHQVTVTATNDCGTLTETFDVLVEDRAGPDLVPVARAVDCDTGLPAPQPIRGTGAAAEPAQALSPGDATAPNGATSTKGATSTNGAREWDAGAFGPAKTELIEPFGGRLLDGRAPGLRRPPEAEELGCGTPCTSGTLTAENPFYDVFVECTAGRYTARTGADHSVTAAASGFPQNVIFGGANGSPGTSDHGFFVHDTGQFFQNPAGAAACSFDPPDTPTEPGSVGLEVEWDLPLDGRNLTLREEVVAFGTTEENSGIRLTLAATNESSSTESVTIGFRWQIDYQNAGDDGPLFATVDCEPPSIVATLDTEHELAPEEIRDFYRIQNNTGSPIFGNFTNTTAIAGFPGTGTPDRLVFAYWPVARGSSWNYGANEGDTFVDSDSTVLYYFGYRPEDAVTLAPGESVRRSVVIFTSGESVECSGFVPGDGGDADLSLCVGDCAELGAAASDACGEATLTLADASPGAPPCVGVPCTVEFPDPGTYVYTWEAVDEAGNVTTATSTVSVGEGGDCGGCDASVVAPPADRTTCRGDSTELDGSGVSITGCAGEVRHEWREADGTPVGETAVVSVSPESTTTYVLTAWCEGDATCAVEERVTVTVEAPPAMAPAVAADLAPCNLGLEITWSAAAFSNPAGGVYNLYRSAVSCADALARPPIATGLTGTSHVDTTTDVGDRFLYVVEAEDGGAAQACTPTGPHHGGAVDRTCTGFATDALEGGRPEGVFATLFASHVGQEVTLEWSTARALLPEEHFHLLKARDSAVSSFALANGEGTTSRRFTETDTSSRIQFFDLRVANACELQSLDEFPAGYDVPRP